MNAYRSAVPRVAFAAAAVALSLATLVATVLLPVGFAPTAGHPANAAPVAATAPCTIVNPAHVTEALAEPDARQA